MPETNDLEALIADLARNKKLGQSEMATRLWAVDPVLEALSWRLRDPNEVEPEYPVLDGRVDYCLRLRGRSRVFIEVKRTGTDLSEHQQQLLRYAFQEGVDLGVLTDGLVWWLYLPGGAGGSVWEHRRFYSLDVTREPAGGAAASLRRFLGREATACGDALDAAKSAFERLERERRVRGALPQAWEELVSEPDDLLVELLRDRVAAISGDLPDAEAAVEFLRGTLAVEPTARPPAPRQRRRTPPRTDAGSRQATPGSESRPAGTVPSERRKALRTSVTAYWLDGRRYRVENGRAMIEALCNQLIEETGDDFDRRIAPLRTANRFSSAPRGRAVQLRNGTFLDVTLSTANISELARRVVVAVRGPKEADSFRIDLE